jgi:hypothetical protein
MSPHEAFLARFALIVGPRRPEVRGALPTHPDDLLEFTRENLGWLREKYELRFAIGAEFDPWIFRRFPDLRDEVLRRS